MGLNCVFDRLQQGFHLDHTNMPPRGRSAGSRRGGGLPHIFAGIDRQALAAQRPRPAGGQLEVHGEPCRIFDDDGGVAAGLEAGEHLLPCFGDEGTTADRFDARLLLTAAPAAARNRGNREGTAESEEEAMFDAERYRDLTPDGSELSDSDSDDEHPSAGGR